MREAIREAKKAAEDGEVPIGAVIVRDDKIIARGHNETERGKDPTLHAEMNAVRNAAAVLGGWRLTGCSMYVTCEPCAMCAGALVWARIEHLYIGTMDPKGGACGSVFNIVQEPRLNHEMTVESGILEEECAELLRNFFSDLRIRMKERKRLRRSASLNDHAGSGSSGEDLGPLPVDPESMDISSTDSRNLTQKVTEDRE